MGRSAPPCAPRQTDCASPSRLSGQGRGTPTARYSVPTIFVRGGRCRRRRNRSPTSRLFDREWWSSRQPHSPQTAAPPTKPRATATAVGWGSLAPHSETPRGRCAWSPQAADHQFFSRPPRQTPTSIRIAPCHDFWRRRLPCRTGLERVKVTSGATSGGRRFFLSPAAAANGTVQHQVSASSGLAVQRRPPLAPVAVPVPPGSQVHGCSFRRLPGPAKQAAQVPPTPDRVDARHHHVGGLRPDANRADGVAESRCRHPRRRRRASTDFVVPRGAGESLASWTGARSAAEFRVTIDCTGGTAWVQPRSQVRAAADRLRGRRSLLPLVIQTGRS